MSRLLTAAALALSLTAGLTGAVSAQSYNAPAGIPAATAPGNLGTSAGAGHGQRFERSATGSVDGVDTTGAVRRARPAR